MRCGSITSSQGSRDMGHALAVRRAGVRRSRRCGGVVLAKSRTGPRLVPRLWDGTGRRDPAAERGSWDEENDTVRMALALVLPLLAVPAPAHAGHRVVEDPDDFEVPYVAIERAHFAYGRRVKATVDLTSLTAVDGYGFQARGPHGHTWSVGWARDGSRYFTHFMWPGESADRVRCRVRWSEDIPCTDSHHGFPSSCLRIGGRPVPWLRVTMSAEGHGDDGGFLMDSAPGGNSSAPSDATFTGRIRRG